MIAVPKLTLAFLYLLAVGALILGAILESIAFFTVSILASLSIIAFGISIAGPRALNPFDGGRS